MCCLFVCVVVGVCACFNVMSCKMCALYTSASVRASVCVYVSACFRFRFRFHIQLAIRCSVKQETWSAFRNLCTLSVQYTYTNIKPGTKFNSATYLNHIIVNKVKPWSLTFSFENEVECIFVFAPLLNGLTTYNTNISTCSFTWFILYTLFWS